VGSSNNVDTLYRSWHRPAVPTPESVWPFPKAPERRGTIRGGKHAIPEKDWTEYKTNGKQMMMRSGAGWLKKEN
jgi:hypothetical protein